MEFKSSRHRQSAQSSTGIVRDDSDDELGAEDHPWEWLSDPVDEAPSEKNALSTRKRTRLHSNARVIGARMGDFECRVGDCVLLKAEGSKEAWVAIICEFIDDDDGEKAANFMWFATEKEIRNTKKKRQDFLPNELYISPSWDINPLAAINGKATIHSQQEFIRAYPSGRVPRSSPDYGKVFVCRRGCNIRTATYSDEFVWEDLYRSGEQGAQKLIAFAKSQIGSTRKRHLARESSPELPYIIDDGKTEAWTPRATGARRPSDGHADTTPSSRKRFGYNAYSPPVRNFKSVTAKSLLTGSW
ncbi:Origin recognition complex subunit 1 [Colletotrichum trifolii]|uniref:Origin recognition complex subunit 1 n=1 Tax=Colletotrichum trifolii TaxID=5466 RepID=A0A4R8PZT0_COLTR|nr:Origin recognition complex subunit 1 [Colletotrichum trifolii]